MAAEASRCEDCPARWPEVARFTGLPLLRAVIRLEGGGLISNADRTQELPYLELRDRERPYALAVEGSAVRLLEDDPVDASLKLLIRPDGARFCAKPSEGQACMGLSYSPVPDTRRVVIGEAALRVTFFEIPDWVEPR